jgi:hypothetical protein
MSICLICHKNLQLLSFGNPHVISLNSRINTINPCLDSNCHYHTQCLLEEYYKNIENKFPIIMKCSRCMGNLTEYLMKNYNIPTNSEEYLLQKKLKNLYSIQNSIFHIIPIFLIVNFILYNVASNKHLEKSYINIISNVFQIIALISSVFFSVVLFYNYNNYFYNYSLNDKYHIKKLFNHIKITNVVIILIFLVILLEMIINLIVIQMDHKSIHMAYKFINIVYFMICMPLLVVDIIVKTSKYFIKSNTKDIVETKPLIENKV